MFHPSDGQISPPTSNLESQHCPLYMSCSKQCCHLHISNDVRYLQSLYLRQRYSWKIACHQWKRTTWATDCYISTVFSAKSWRLYNPSITIIYTTIFIDKFFESNHTDIPLMKPWNVLLFCLCDVLIRKHSNIHSWLHGWDVSVIALKELVNQYGHILHELPCSVLVTDCSVHLLLLI